MIRVFGSDWSELVALLEDGAPQSRGKEELLAPSCRGGGSWRAQPHHHHHPKTRPSPENRGGTPRFSSDGTMLCCRAAKGGGSYPGANKTGTKERKGETKKKMAVRGTCSENVVRRADSQPTRVGPGSNANRQNTFQLFHSLSSHLFFIYEGEKKIVYFFFKKKLGAPPCFFLLPKGEKKLLYFNSFSNKKIIKNITK